MPIRETQRAGVFVRKKMRKRAYILLAVVAVVLCAWFFIDSVARNPTRVELSVTRTPSPVASSQSEIIGLSAVVHLVGEVRKPGLYSVQVGARVIDAVLAAGGLTPRADQCGINLARIVTDGEQMVIPSKPAGAESACFDKVTNGSQSPNTSSSKISLSRASVGELDALPGIGPALAQRIIDWRTAHGGFKSVNDLDDVSGIGSAMLKQLIPLVTP